MLAEFKFPNGDIKMVDMFSNVRGYFHAGSGGRPEAVRFISTISDIEALGDDKSREKLISWMRDCEGALRIRESEAMALRTELARCLEELNVHKNSIIKILEEGE